MLCYSSVPLAECLGMRKIIDAVAIEIIPTVLARNNGLVLLKDLIREMALSNQGAVCA